MISDELFGECLVILQDDSILEEDQAERISGLISSKTNLEGSTLENAVLDVLWRHRNKGSPASSPPVRNNHTIIRRASPAPWQFQRVGTPTPSLSGTPPMHPPGFPPSLRSSPFPSPRPSPRLAYSSPLIPHSPTLNNYEPVLHQDVTSAPSETYGDLGSDTVQWLIGDDSAFLYGAGPTQNMTPHDMLRSVLGEGRSDDQIDQALEICSYDLGATLAMLMDQQQQQNSIHLCTPAEHAITIGKSTTPNLDRSRPITPRNGIVCRFFLSNGQCLRADCRFSHDLGTTICKYWLMGSCLAGDMCIFSHDPTMSVSKMTLGSDSRTSTPPPHLQFQDHSAFPSLSPDHWGAGAGSGMLGPPPGFKITPSRPNSRQQARDRDQNSSLVPPVDDSEAFPSLGSAKSSSHKKRDRRAKNEIPTGPSSLAEVVRMGSPGPRWSGVGGNAPNAKRGSRVSAAHIPPPQQIPWLDTGSSLNRTYLKHRKEALSHGVLRAKYLQMASAAWQRNDAKAAKEHSRKANNENLAMVKAHKEASKAIYEERNKLAGQGVELFVDLHGLLTDEAIKYLEDVLVAHQTSTLPLYAIVGTGHHSKGGKDKLSRAIRAFLDEWKYAYREFSATGDRNSSGGILGIDPSSFSKELLGEEGADGKKGARSSSGDGAGTFTTTTTTTTATTTLNGKKDPGKKK